MIDHLDLVQRRTAANHDLAFASPPLTGGYASDLAADHPTAQLPAAILDAVTAQLRAGQTHYVDVPGIAPLRKRLSDALRAEGRSPAEAAGVVVTAGIQEARFLAIQVLAETHRHVALPDVVHPGVRQALGVRLPERRATMATDPARGYQVPLAEIDRVLAAGANLLVLESPVRLTGAHYDAATMRAIGERVAAAGAQLILDDGMAPWAGKPATCAADAAHVTVIGEAFPGVGLEAWALGFIAGAAERTASYAKLKQIMSICTSTPSQLAAVAAVDAGATDVSERRTALAAARDRLIRHAHALGLRALPGGAAHVLAVTGAQHAPAGAAAGAAFGAPATLRLLVEPESLAAAVLTAAAGGRR
jgi:aminotransferase